MDPMDIDHPFDVPDTPIRPATRGMDGRRSRAIHPSSFPSHSEEQNLLEGTKGRPVVIDSGSRGRSVRPQKSASSFTNDHLFRRRIFENVNFRSQDSIHARQLQSIRPPRISNTSSSSLDDHFADEKEGNLHTPVTGKTSSSGMRKDIQVEFPKQSGLSNGTSSHGMGKFLNASCDSSKETDNLNEVDSSIEHREVVGFVGNVRTEPAKGNSISVYPISSPKVNRQKQLVRNGCISSNNIAQGKQLAKKNINDPEDEAHNNYGTVALSSPPNSIDIRNLVADDNDSYTRKGKGIMSYPNSFKGHDVKIKSLHGSEKAVENGDSIIHAGKSIEELGGWRRTGNRTRGIYISSSAGGEQHLGREMDGSRYPCQHQNNRLEIREDGGKSFLVDNGHPEVQDLTSPEHVSPQPLTGSMPYHRVQFEQLNGSHSMVDSIIKRQRQGSTSSSCGESSALAPNDPEIVCLDSPVEAAHQKSTSRRETFHRIFNVDEVSPPLRHNAQDEDARAMQVEADERLARELQEQLYNEFPVFGIGEIVEHISLALEQQDDSNHDIFQRGSSRTNFTRQSQSSSSNVLRRGSVSREAAARRMARFRSRLDGQPRAVLPSRRTSIFPADMDVDMRMHILGTLEEFNDIRVRSGFLQMEHDFNENDYEMLLALDDNNDQHLGASAHHINNLPQSVVQTDNFEETCTICLEIPTVGDTIRHLPCLHKFHKDCIDEWLRRRTSCPVCKSSIT